MVSCKFINIYNSSNNTLSYAVSYQSLSDHRPCISTNLSNYLMANSNCAIIRRQPCARLQNSTQLRFLNKYLCLNRDLNLRSFIKFVHILKHTFTRCNLQYNNSCLQQRPSNKYIFS